MTDATWSRRAILTALAGAAAGPVLAQPAGRPLARGALAGNPLALSFEAAPANLRLPDLMLAGPRGPRRLSQLGGRTLLVPLWAEWCAPCIAEMPDFAALQARHGAAGFAIVPIMTASKRKLNPAGAARILAKVKAGRFEALVEPNGGDALYRALAVGGARSRPTLPCNLLVDRTGRVVARQFGGMMMSRTTNKADLPPGVILPKPGPSGTTTTTTTIVLSEAQKKAMMARAMSGDGRSAWASPAADAFVAALAGGLLDRS